jgi:oxalate decarboxylase/phosphoglucose isomerase-like protein (cupin superfamily)
MHVSNLDAAKPFRTTDGSVIRELAGRVSLPSVNQSLAEASLPAGGATDEHYHPLAEERYFFIAGTAPMRLGDEQRPASSTSSSTPATSGCGCCVAAPPPGRLTTPS